LYLVHKTYGHIAKQLENKTTIVEWTNSLYGNYDTKNSSKFNNETWKILNTIDVSEFIRTTKPTYRATSIATKYIPKYYTI